ncbi:uroporphyrinogen-III C-methyltransferase [Saccharophagus degradans]|uniref:uroporphyrinogen-III C-methyltransferase n=1 Tax=Saccharophagus degradans TaxID=86304 RepID=UPI001C08CD0B|nr:uroporphyrinogen-III C-methyltransferase [Saccharophagus degradans]MBU2985053.1 uroporphyrinogen-III C-methyltransferase [Saccharophagus degradans]
MSDKKPTDAAEESPQSEEVDTNKISSPQDESAENASDTPAKDAPIEESETLPAVNVEQTGATDASAAQQPESAGERTGESADKNALGEAIHSSDSSNKTSADNSNAGMNTSSSASNKPADMQSKPGKKRTGLWFALILVLIVLGALGYGAYYADAWLKNRDAQTQAQLEQLKQQQMAQTQNINAIAQSQSRFNEVDKSLAAQLQQSEQRLAAAEQRLALQNKRLLSMSTTSRDDWLLAEAQYLLKLANQRILVERSAAGADALLTEADGILRDLGDPDLFPLRQALAKDLAQVRLVDKIDLEGMYLQLQALSNSVEKLPVKPTWDQLADNGEIKPLLPNTESEEQQATAEQNTNTEEQGLAAKLWGKTVQGFGQFTGKLDDYIRVRHHDIAPEPMMSPQATMYLQQNLRLVLERAQLALLREQPEIYQSSLAQATLWLKKYYPNTQAREAFIAQLDQLAATPIVQTLPDISQSLELLHTYIAELHQLKGVEKNTGDKQ